MIKGMTGFGTAEVAWKQVKGTVEIKSQNHRYLDLVFYLPIGFSVLEERIRQMLTTHIKRGRVNVSFKMSAQLPEQHILNRAVIKEYLKQARQLKREFSIEDKLTLSDLLKLPDVVEIKTTPLDVQLLWPGLDRSIKQALKSCTNMRKREGRSLSAELKSILKKMLGLVGKIQRHGRTLLTKKKKVLTPEEFLSFQKSNDISEELARLKHYLQEFRHHLSSASPVGKKLDFVAQEMQRETNTIGSKMQDTVIANAVIALKSHIEKLREQAQNIE